VIVPGLRADREEIIDREGTSERGRAILSDLDRFNHLFGWTRFHLRQVRAHWEAQGRPTPFRILDVGTGPGGLLEALARSDLPVQLHGVDRSEAYVAMAQARLGGAATVFVGDATALPFGDGEVHLATSTLMLHHLSSGARTALVAELARVARSAYLFDVEPSISGVLGWPLACALLGFGPDTRHDGIASVRRAVTRDELAALVRPLPVRVRRVFPSALCTVAAPGSARRGDTTRA